MSTDPSLQDEPLTRRARLWRLILRCVGVILVLVGLCVAYLWFYKLGPTRRTLDPRWRCRHSQQELWEEVQKSIHRGVWSHDDGFAVGIYGDKSWAEWIMNHVEPGASMGCLGGEPQHSATAMRFITNQNAGEDADQWLDWWEKNKSKRQEEWIADGFAKQGVKIDVPPKPEQTPDLLAVLGRSEPDEATAISEPLRYNAFRCLRDIGFNPVEFALSKPTIPSDVERGLLEYAKRQRRWPTAIGAGILPFASADEDRDDVRLPTLLTLSFQITAYALIFVPGMIGTILVILSFSVKMQRRGPDSQ
jgi:hypothetical protein